MTILRIEHPITSYEVWKAAFDRFAQARADAGVRSHLISRPAEDDRYVIIDLDFETVGQAERFLGFLRQRVWSSPEASPALDGEPRTRVLEVVDRG